MEHITEIIDDILTEWAYQVNDGMPDVNNPLHMAQLEHSLYDLEFSPQFIVEFMNNLREGKFQARSAETGKVVDFKSKESMEDAIKDGRAEPLDNGGKEEPEKPAEEKPKEKPKITTIDANPFSDDAEETDTGDKDTAIKDSPEIQLKREEEKQEFLLSVANGLLAGSTESKGVGRFNMSKEDLDKYKSYLGGNKPEIPNYDISDDEVDEIISIIKSTMTDKYQGMVQRIRKKGDPPKQYSTGEAGKERFFNVLKHYMQTGGKSSITGEFVPFSESQLDHVTSLDNGGEDGPENWEWMESRFNQFKGALSDESVMAKIKNDLDKSPDEDKLKTLNQSLKKYSKQAYIKYYDNKFKTGGSAGLTEESINNMNADMINYVIKGWNKSHPEGSDFFIPRYESKKDPLTGKEVDRSSGRASGGRAVSKSILLQRLFENMKGAGVDIPSKTETDKIDKEIETIVKQIEKQKGEISGLKQKIKQQKIEN